MKEQTALKRETDGTLSRIAIYESTVGLHTNPMDATYETRPLVLTGETDKLRGWGQLDGWADIYETAAGIEILIPRRDEEKLKTARVHLDIAIDLAQRVADYAKEMKLVGPAQREIEALRKATRLLREAGIQLRMAGIPQKKTSKRTTMLDDIVPEVGMRVFAERHGSPEPAKICSLVGNMYDEAWVAFEDGERARRRVDKLLKWTAPEEPCTCTNEESDPCDRCRNDANRQRA